MFRLELIKIYAFNKDLIQFDRLKIHGLEN